MVNIVTMTSTSQGGQVTVPYKIDIKYKQRHHQFILPFTFVNLSQSTQAQWKSEETHMYASLEGFLEEKK